MNRRSLISRLAALPLVPAYLRAGEENATATENSAPASNFVRALQALKVQASAIDAMRADRVDVVALQSGLEHAPIAAPKSNTMIDPRASDLIITCEVGSQQLYTRKYQAPTWPAGDSGITIGIGYDIGYETVDQLRRDWQAFLSVDQIEKLSEACGITAIPAKQLLQSIPSMRIDWGTASKQYFQETQPRWVGETEHALPNCASLNAISLGALVSLVYNRGNSFSMPSSRDSTNRFAEMRNIKQHMIAKQFELIPAEIRAMKRLWVNEPELKGLLIRRELEAQLFEKGLALSR